MKINLHVRDLLLESVTSIIADMALVSCVVDLKNKTNKDVRKQAIELKDKICDLSDDKLWSSCVSIPETTNKFYSEDIFGGQGETKATPVRVLNPYSVHAQTVKDIGGGDSLLVIITNRLRPVLNTHAKALNESVKLFIIYLNDDKTRCKREQGYLEKYLELILPNVEYVAREIGRHGKISDAAITKTDKERIVGVDKIVPKEVSASYIILYASDAGAPAGLQEVGIENVEGLPEEAYEEFEKFCNKERPNWARLISSDGETCFCKYKNKGTFTKIVENI